METVSVKIVKRLKRSNNRKCIIDEKYTSLSILNLPPAIQELKKNNTMPKCNMCLIKNAQWYIFPVCDSSEAGKVTTMGLNNRATPGLKCNACKNNFFETYLSPNWLIDGDENYIVWKTDWQPFGIISLPLSS